MNAVVFCPKTDRVLAQFGSKFWGKKIRSSEEIKYRNSLVRKANKDWWGMCGQLELVEMACGVGEGGGGKKRGGVFLERVGEVLHTGSDQRGQKFSKVGPGGGGGIGGGIFQIFDCQHQKHERKQFVDVIFFKFFIFFIFSIFIQLFFVLLFGTPLILCPYYHPPRPIFTPSFPLSPTSCV